MQHSAQIVVHDEVWELSPRRGLDLAHPFAQLRGNDLQVEGFEEALLVSELDLFPIFPDQ